MLIYVMIVSCEGLPGFYCCTRVGAHGKNFTMYKFRSMRKNAPELATDAIENPEQYIFPLGKMLRVSSLDELPQLINILKGEMSFVGPRPALESQQVLLEARKSAGLSNLRPGLSGFAQIAGRDNNSIDEKVRLEVLHLRHNGLSDYLRVVARTIAVVLLRLNIRH